MKKTLQSYNFIDTLGEAYEALLESTESKMHQSSTAFHLMVNALSGNNTTGHMSTKIDNTVKNYPVYATPYNFIDALGEAYEALLESALRKVHGASSVVRQMIDVFFGNSEHVSSSIQPGKYMKHAVVVARRQPDRIDRK